MQVFWEQNESLDTQASLSMLKSSVGSEGHLILKTGQQVRWKVHSTIQGVHEKSLQLQPSQYSDRLQAAPSYVQFQAQAMRFFNRHHFQQPPAINSSDYTVSNGIVINQLEKMWKETVITPKYYLDICMRAGGTREMRTERLSDDMSPFSAEVKSAWSLPSIHAISS